MRVLTPDSFAASAWKNGGGVTREIARDPPDGPWRWRLSIAEVASDGAFSAFPGLSRILTVIEGSGVDLHGSDGVIAALPLRPVAFARRPADRCAAGGRPDPRPERDLRRGPHRRLGRVGRRAVPDRGGAGDHGVPLPCRAGNGGRRGAAGAGGSARVTRRDQRRRRVQRPFGAAARPRLSLRARQRADRLRTRPRPPALPEGEGWTCSTICWDRREV